MSDSNLSFVLKEKLNFHFENRAIPTDIEDYDVLLKILNVGICGSDVHYWLNGGIGEFIVKNPIILGHETSAEVVKCGAKVSTLKIGDRVALEPGVPCRRCSHCLSGRYNLCTEMKFHATPPYDGTLCEYISHPEDFCFKLPNHVSSEEGALLEPLSVGIHACRRGNVQLGSKVLIIGTGTIGLVNLLVARSMGADTVIVIDLDEKRLRLAKDFGADFIIKTTKESKINDILEEIKKNIDCLVDVTIECSGSSNALNLGIAATTSGGCIVMVGMGAPEITAPLLNACIREVDIRGVFRYVNCFPAALSLLSQGKIDVKSLITHRFQFSNAMDAFEMVKKGDGIKVMIDVGNNKSH